MMGGFPHVKIVLIIKSVEWTSQPEPEVQTESPQDESSKSTV
jgi:hypothetical protein